MNGNADVQIVGIIIIITFCETQVLNWRSLSFFTFIGIPRTVFAIVFDSQLPLRCYCFFFGIDLNIVSSRTEKRNDGCLRIFTSLYWENSNVNICFKWIRGYGGDGKRKTAIAHISKRTFRGNYVQNVRHVLHEIYVFVLNTVSVQNKLNRID